MQCTSKSWWDASWRLWGRSALDRQDWVSDGVKAGEELVETLLCGSTRNKNTHMVVHYRAFNRLHDDRQHSRDID